MKCCCCEDSLLSQISDFANIIVAIAGFALAFYVFYYQRVRENLNTRLQWFKDLIIEPNKAAIYSFYEALGGASEGFRQTNLTDQNKAEILKEIKIKCASFRKQFINLLFTVDSKMANDILRNIDVVVDKITTNVDNEAIDLTRDTQFEYHILSHIYNNRNYTLFRIFQYEGGMGNRKNRLLKKS